MRVSVERWADCRPDLVLLWQEMRRANPELASPYFHPKFTGIVNSVWPQPVELGIIHEHDGIKAILPFHRLESGIGVPVGHFLSDYHGLICRPGYQCDLREVIRQCGLSAFDYDHALASQPFGGRAEPSPQIDLSHGDYLTTQKAVKSEQIKIRRIERNLGPLRLVTHSGDYFQWTQFVSWKMDQYDRTNARNILGLEWVQSVLERVRDAKDKNFSGLFSLLFAGKNLVAAHLGMRSGPLLHSWFPAYDSLLSTYSPGLLLLIKLIEAAPELGITKIDLGKGMYEWKTRFANDSSNVISGSIELPSVLTFRRVTRRLVGAGARRLRLR